ncbi:vegetative cell wall protein gp1-like [Sarcophilus harrisii]|uniref:vegetative cell wall protein gp1-like n=1 Tax=Sarcophilus harrisii TaxID=9305 RepID=UPI001301CD9F|nr:vegetative cell wall protein gp1-like [Sarcophilus harrisii]
MLALLRPTAEGQQASRPAPPLSDSLRKVGGEAAPPGAPLPSPPGHLRVRARARESDGPNCAPVSPPSQRSLPAPTAASPACLPARPTAAARVQSLPEAAGSHPHQPRLPSPPPPPPQMRQQGRDLHRIICV